MHTTTIDTSQKQAARDGATPLYPVLFALSAVRTPRDRAPPGRDRGGQNELEAAHLRLLASLRPEKHLRHERQPESACASNEGHKGGDMGPKGLASTQGVQVGDKRIGIKKCAPKRRRGGCWK